MLKDSNNWVNEKEARLKETYKLIIVGSVRLQVIQ
jgi:hypothetical protein